MGLMLVTSFRGKMVTRTPWMVSVCLHLGSVCTDTVSAENDYQQGAAFSSCLVQRRKGQQMPSYWLDFRASEDPGRPQWGGREGGSAASKTVTKHTQNS